MSVQGVLRIAYSQLGVTEAPPNSNNVLYNTDYYGQRVSGDEYPWCTVFLWDIFRMAGESEAFYGGNKTASCTELKNYYAKFNRWFTTGTPREGDIVILTFSSDREIQHCGIVYRVLGNTIYTIEGNTSPGIEGSQDNGGCVAYKERSLNNIVGYCRIIYSDQVDQGGSVSYDDSVLMSQQSSLLYKNQSMFLTQKVSTDVTRDTIMQVDREYNEISSQSNNLLSYPSLVEAPYILVKIGDYTFGQYTEKRSAGKLYKTYPNYITSLDVLKINGQVNVYTIKMLYQVQYLDDPNFLDKIFSSVGYGKIKISYGDFASPSFIYKEEEAIITKVTTNVDFSSSKIEYTISCTSCALSAQGSNFSFPRYSKEKPSKVIRSVLQQADYYHLTNVFPGLTGKNLNKNFYKFVASDDLAVEIPAQQYMDPISYINYLVSCMIPQEDTVSDATRSATYYMTIHDDSYADYSDVGGTYFKVTKILSTYKTLPTFNTYTVDVGYPGGDHPGENLVMNFQLKDDNSWALLYDYSQSDISGSQQNYSYSISNSGQIVRNYSPNITVSAVHGKTTPAMKAWWTRMTEFPISATLTIKGLIRAAMLMTYLRVNTYFYGKKHVSSGLYVITKQEDRIDGSGYRTTLSLTRIAGEDEYIERKKYTQVSEIITGAKQPQIQPKTIPVDQEVETWKERSIITDINQRNRYHLTSDCQKYVVYATEFADAKYAGKIFTNINEFPFVDGDIPVTADNRMFVIRALENCWTADGEAREPEYFDDVWGVESQWENRFGWQGTLVMVQEGDQVYFHPTTYTNLDAGKHRDGEPLEFYQLPYISDYVGGSGR